MTPEQQKELCSPFASTWGCSYTEVNPIVGRGGNQNIYSIPYPNAENSQNQTSRGNGVVLDHTYVLGDENHILGGNPKHPQSIYAIPRATTSSSLSDPEPNDYTGDGAYSSIYYHQAGDIRLSRHSLFDYPVALPDTDYITFKEQQDRDGCYDLVEHEPRSLTSEYMVTMPLKESTF